MFRFISLALRKIQAKKTPEKVLAIFKKQVAEIDNLPDATPSKKLLIIRLDDIGDYIVFRNFLDAYKHSEKWKNYSISLLGNIAWKDLFEEFDEDKVDEVIWVDKRQYFEDEIYRNKTWNDLRNQSFEVVINPSRTRPLLLDDACALATGAIKKIASANTFMHVEWNEVSDCLYNEIFLLKQPFTHEFIFNRIFTEWCCDIKLETTFPKLSGNVKSGSSNYLIFFIGASAKSKRWTTKRWIDLIKIVTNNYPYKIFIAGGAADIKRADKIALHSNAENIAGKTSLTGMIDLITNAIAVVTNDTMATHASVACNTPVVIIANGNNYYRFTDYEFLENKNIITVYPQIFLNKLKKGVYSLLHYEAVSADIATIPATKVFELLQKLLP